MAQSKSNLPEFFLKPRAFNGAFAAVAVVVGIAAAVAIRIIDNPIAVVVAVVGMPAVFLAMAKVDYSLMFMAFMIYTRLSDVMQHYHGLPSIFQPYLAFMLGLLFVHWYFYGREMNHLQTPVVVYAIYFLMMFSSLLYVQNFDRAMFLFERNVKAMVVGFIIILALQRVGSFRYIVWGLLLSGILMGMISTYQYLTGTYSNNYWGFGQAAVQHITDDVNDYRIGGSIGDPNFYSQLMVVLIPLALNRVWNEKHVLLRVVAGCALVVTLLTVVFTFSRGALIATAAALGLMMIRKPPKISAVLVTILLVVPLWGYVPDSYKERMSTLTDLIPSMDEDEGNALVEEVSYRGRLSEMLIGIYMFEDHIFMGVGINNYPEHYQEYSRELGLDPRVEDRSAHSTYIQIMAEHGLMGIFVFGGIVLFSIHGMWVGEREFHELGLHDDAEMSFAFMSGFVGYLVAAIFLHLNYPRMFWMLLSVGLALPGVVKNERMAQEGVPIVSEVG